LKLSSQDFSEIPQFPFLSADFTQIGGTAALSNQYKSYGSKVLVTSGIWRIIMWTAGSKN